MKLKQHEPPGTVENQLRAAAILVRDYCRIRRTGGSTRKEQIMQQTELAESLNQFVTIWKMIGRPFPQVDQTDRPGLAISWPNTDFSFLQRAFSDRTADG
jgi:hypothetical protein